jgi:hypothetical protein
MDTHRRHQHHVKRKVETRSKLLEAKGANDFYPTTGNSGRGLGQALPRGTQKGSGLSMP